MNKIMNRLIIFMTIILGFNNVFGAGFIYENKENDDKEKTEAKSESYISDESSVATATFSPQFTFQSEAQVLMEASSGKIIYASNEDEKLLPASVTKIMTLLLTMQQIDGGKLKYDDKVVCSAKAASMGGSQIWFKEGEELTVDEALKCICVVSANDVTVAMAEKIGGSEENFVAMMNDKANKLGMVNTHFMNSHGIDEEGHYTTARDIAIMSRELIEKHPDILKYTSIWMDSIRGGTFDLSSTNKLIRYYEGATGLKTGSTSKALFNLSGTATRNGTTFIAVVMKAPSSDIRLSEIKQLLDYGFANYETKKLIEEDEIIESKSVNKNINELAEIRTKSDIVYVTEKGQIVDAIQNITYNQDFNAPLESGEVVGRLEIIDKVTGEKLGETELVTKSEVQRSSLQEYFIKVLKMYIMNENN